MSRRQGSGQLYICRGRGRDDKPYTLVGLHFPRQDVGNHAMYRFEVGVGCLDFDIVLLIRFRKQTG